MERNRFANFIKIAEDPLYESGMHSNGIALDYHQTHSRKAPISPWKSAGDSILRSDKSRSPRKARREQNRTQCSNHWAPTMKLSRAHHILGATTILSGALARTRTPLHCGPLPTLWLVIVGKQHVSIKRTQNSSQTARATL